MAGTAIILTGASRGLGAALARALAAPGTHLVTVARRPDPSLAAAVAGRGGTLEQIAADLSDPAQAARAAGQAAAALPCDAAHYRLINNAGTLQPLARAEDLTDALAVSAALNLNVGAAIAMTAAFLRATSAAADRRVLNISSGAGRSPYAGWHVYCATKAALDMFTRTLALEHGTSGLRAVSLAPGVIDTDMQAAIRAADPAAMPMRPRFVDLHARGALPSAEQVAARLTAYLEHADFGAREIDDLRQAG